MHLWWQSAFEYKDKDNFGGDENSDADERRVLCRKRLHARSKHQRRKDTQRLHIVAKSEKYSTGSSFGPKD